jgi:hypothetical protein
MNRPIWSKRAYLHPENYDLQEVFLSKTNSVHTVIKCARAAASNKDGFLWRDTCVFFNSAE